MASRADVFEWGRACALFRLQVPEEAWSRRQTTARREPMEAAASRLFISPVGRFRAPPRSLSSPCVDASWVALLAITTPLAAACGMPLAAVCVGRNDVSGPHHEDAAGWTCASPLPAVEAHAMKAARTPFSASKPRRPPTNRAAAPTVHPPSASAGSRRAPPPLHVSASFAFARCQCLAPLARPKGPRAHRG